MYFALSLKVHFHNIFQFWVFAFIKPNGSRTTGCFKRFIFFSRIQPIIRIFVHLAYSQDLYSTVYTISLPVFSVHVKLLVYTVQYAQFHSRYICLRISHVFSASDKVHYAYPYIQVRSFHVYPGSKVSFRMYEKGAHFNFYFLK
jgi:hypothetical protein